MKGTHPLRPQHGFLTKRTLDETTAQHSALLVILGGMLILFYPTISNFLIMRNASRAVNNYDASVEALSQEQYQKVLDAAHAYNEKLAQNDAGETDVLASAVDSASTDEEYNSLLNIDGDGDDGIHHCA